jgi:hypothetical protein
MWSGGSTDIAGLVDEYSRWRCGQIAIQRKKKYW